ncbi:MAG: thioesterase domain-containing protein, partial [Gammaproteobacteria bacterium]
LRQTLFPLLRSEFRSVAEYGPNRREQLPLSAPITGIAAHNDLFAAPKAMESWGQFTQAEYRLAQLPGDHYFVESDRESIIALLVDTLTDASTDESIDAPVAATRHATQHMQWVECQTSALGQVPITSVKSETQRQAWRTRGEAAAKSQKIQVICLPPAGLGADDLPYEALSQNLLRFKSIDWHGESIDSPLDSIDKIADHLFEVLAPTWTEPSLLFGHCLGATVAYELALRMQDQGIPPLGLVVAGVVAPHLYVAPNAHLLPDEKLVELMQVVKYPYAHELEVNALFRRNKLDLLRRDLKAMATYEYRSQAPLVCPITALSLRHDLWSYPLRTNCWRYHTHQRFEVKEWPGDHYQPLQRMDDVRSIILSHWLETQQSIDAFSDKRVTA